MTVVVSEAVTARVWRGGFGSVNEAIEMLTSKVRDNLGFPEKVNYHDLV